MALPPRVSDLTSFDLLLSVARLGSIGRAAAAHQMSQPAASARLRQLERQLGARLLERQARGTQLTTVGEVVAGWAQPVVDRAADLEAGIAALRRDRATQLRIAASLTVAEYLLPGWLIALRTADPETVTTLSCGNSAEVAVQVLGGQADIGFVEGPAVPAGVEAREVARDELAVVVAPSHPWARRRRVRPAELAATPLLSREAGSGTREAWERAVRAQVDIELAAPMLEMSSTTAIKAAAIGGIGPAVLSVRAVAAELAAGTLVRLSAPGLDLTRRLRAIWPAGQPVRGAAGDLLAIALRT
ncbi:LysR family transcriptional regulator [Fodinicola acaciae]|uniref:LysR family transcriptional regulator n=1 Tax=Fodinicola acaciae TaxID=2681555 RepID=UPI0013D52CBA|nr:LysR family transcriptional regulator [Fodinicola acaciae]